MDNYKAEKSIRGAFQSLPRKNIEQGGKQAVWSLVQDHIRETRLDSPARQARTAIPSPARLIFGLRLSRVTITAFSVVLAVIFVGAAAQAAKGSIPGDTLYTVKIASEYVEILLATSDESKAEVLKEHAENRLDEIQTLVTESASDELVTKTLENLKSTTEELYAVTESAASENPELIDGVVELAVEQEQVLTLVEEEVEGEVKEAVQEILTASRESIAQLQAGQEEVEGITEAADEPTEEAVRPAEPTIAEEEPEDLIESPVQTHGVIKSNPDEEEDNEPKILPDPGFSF